MLDSPIILLCSERSGSNLITRIFDAHPEICAPGASHLFKVMAETACRYPRAGSELRAAVLELFAAKVSQWKIDSWTAEARAALLDGLETAGEMAAALYAAEAKAAGKRFVFIKENSVFTYLNFLTAVSTTPRYLFFVRDPRDMALSWVNGPVMRGGVVRGTDRWLYDQLGYLETLSQLGPRAQTAYVRYEDLIADPDSQVRAICRDLALEFDPDMLSFHDHSDSAKVDAKRSSMWSNLAKPVMAENSRKFLSGLDDNEVAYIEAMTGPVAATLGYQSVRQGKPAFGAFETLDALRAFLADREPHTKDSCARLPQDERNRFETWSRLYALMKARPVLAPDLLRGAR